MHQKPARLPLNRRRVFRSGLVAALLLLAATVASRAQPVPPPELQLLVVSQARAPGAPPIAPADLDWALLADARIINPRTIGGYIPVVLSITGTLPLLGGAAESTPGLAQVNAFSAAAAPGYYAVVAQASTAAWLARRQALDDQAAIDWLNANMPVADRMELTVTQRVTLVGLSGVTASAYHVALGDPVTFTAALAPVGAAGEAFSWVYWDWLAAWCYSGSGSNYTRMMDASGRDANGVVAVTASCGTSFVTVPITVYQVTNVTASTNLISTSESVTLTAQLDPDPGTNSLPITWYTYVPDPLILFSVIELDCGPGPTLSVGNLPPGTYTYYARCGTSQASASFTVQFGGTLSLTASPEDIPVGTTSTFAATLTPAGTPNSVTWQHPNYSGADYSGGLTREYYFAYAGTQPVSITCDLVTTNKAVRVYEVIAVTASPSLVAVGSNITFTATLYGGPNPPPLVWKVDGVVDTNSTGVTFTTSFATAGVKEVSAWCGPISYKSTTVTNVGVGAIEFYRITSETVGENGIQTQTAVWEAATSPLYLLTGRTAILRARPSPAGAPWPAGQPVWSGTAGLAGTGETVTGATATLSVNLTDFKTIKAECGNSNLLNAIVFDFTNRFSPQPLDDFPGRSYDEYGVTEVVTLAADFNPVGITAGGIGGLEWSTNSGHVWQSTNVDEHSTLVPNPDGTALFGAGSEPESVEIRATLKQGPSAFGWRERQLAVIEPNTAVLKPLKDDLGLPPNALPDPDVYHTTNTASCVKFGLYFLTPTNVSFRGLVAGEGGGTIYRTAVLTSGNVVATLPHTGRGLYQVKHFPGNPNNFGADQTGISPAYGFNPNQIETHLEIGTNHVLFADLLMITEVVNIPILRKWKTTTYTNGTVYSEKTILRNGNVRIKKSDSPANPFDYSKAYSDPTSP